jgi:hypothetical protein
VVALKRARVEFKAGAALGGLGNILSATPEPGQRGQASLPPIKGVIRSERVTFGCRIEDGLPDAL